MEYLYKSKSYKVEKTFKGKIKMAGTKFCSLTFENFSKLVPLQPGDCKDTIIKSFTITLDENEEIFIKDHEKGYFVGTNDLYDLVSSLQKPTDMSFLVQSRSQFIFVLFFS